MEWRTQAYQPLHPKKISEGKPGPEKETSKCRVLYFFENMAVPQTGEPQSMQDQDLVEWLRDREEPESKETKHPDTVPQEIKPDETELRSHKDGFRLLLCGRSESTDSRANFFNIPFNSKDASSRDPQTQDSPAQGARKKYDLQDVLKRFPVHVHMGQVIQRHTPYFSVVDIPAPTKEATRKIIYTAIFDTGLEGFKTNLAFTSTYFPSNKTSFGIILGCTEQDIKNATTLLNKCGSSRNHQLLLPAVFLRLQRQRLAGIRKSHTKYSIELQDNIEEILAYRSGQQPYEFGVRPSKISDCASNLSKLCTNGHVMVADLKIASRQLNRLKRHAEELEKKNTGDKNMEMSSKNTRCFLDLFDEIAEDIEYVSGVISINVKATTTTANEMTRSSTSQDARWSMGLAFVAMAYLPITALATIFALPVFDFKASWRNMDNQPANWSESAGSDGPDSGSPSPSSPPIISIYFTYWIVASLLLTWLTIEVWWVLCSDSEEWRWDRFWSLSQLARIADKMWSWISERSGETRSWFVLWKVRFRSWWQFYVKKQPDHASIA